MHRRVTACAPAVVPVVRLDRNRSAGDEPQPWTSAVCAFRRLAMLEPTTIRNAVCMPVAGSRTAGSPPIRLARRSHRVCMASVVARAALLGRLRPWLRSRLLPRRRDLQTAVLELAAVAGARDGRLNEALGPRAAHLAQPFGLPVQRPRDYRCPAVRTGSLGQFGDPPAEVLPPRCSQ